MELFHVLVLYKDYDNIIIHMKKIVLLNSLCDFDSCKNYNENII